MSTSITRRGIVLIAAAAISLFAALATASQAGAATYYACVKKNGAAHIYTKKPKCKKGESKLSWNNVGPAGKNGANGNNGANGLNGANGTNGANLTTQTPLASGQSESGFFAVADGSSTSGYAATGISFAQPLSAALPENSAVFNAPKTTSTHCPGFGKADRGFLCLYAGEISGLNFLETFDFEFNANAADKYGFSLYFTVSGASGFTDGSWTVTAP